MGGMTDERIRQGVISHKDFENQLMFQMNSGFTPEAYKFQKFAKQVEINGGIGPGMSWKNAFQQSWWEVLQAMNLVYAYKNASMNWNRLTGKDPPFAFNEPSVKSNEEGRLIEYETGRRLFVKPASNDTEIILGTANGLVNAVGSITETAVAVTGHNKPAG